MKIFVIIQVQGLIVLGSGLVNIKNEGFLTVNPEPANLSRNKFSMTFLCKNE